MKYKLSVVASLILSISAAAGAQEWRHSITKDGNHRAEVSAAGETPDGPAQTTLFLECSAENKGRVFVNLLVRGAIKMKGFGFDDFEGPDAVAQNKRLVTIRVESPQRPVVIQTAVGGWYSGEPGQSDAFQFSFSGRAGNVSEAGRLTTAIARGASKILIAVRDNRNRTKQIRSDFPTAGASAAVSEMLEGCRTR